MTAYQTKPLRERYELTAKALELLPVLLALGAWGNRWLAPEGEILTVVDATSGSPLDMAIVDRKTARPVLAGQVALKAGSGATKGLREKLSEPLILGAGHTRR